MAGHEHFFICRSRQIAWALFFFCKGSARPWCGDCRSAVIYCGGRFLLSASSTGRKHSSNDASRAAAANLSRGVCTFRPASRCFSWA
uniref:Putative secreted protein n=1 Tax=Ixodes ricinus TaxID=34613 RepID=A0A6B0UA48_IXORI